MQQAERRQHLEELEDDAHMLAAPGCQLVFAQLVHRLAGDDHLPGGWPVDAGDHIQQGGFAVAGGADDGDKLAGLTLKEMPLSTVTSVLPTGKLLTTSITCTT